MRGVDARNGSTAHGCGKSVLGQGSGGLWGWFVEGGKGGQGEQRKSTGDGVERWVKR